jgi:hypothetical protein
MSTASETTEQPRSAGLRALLGGPALVACCTLSLVSVSVADARGDRGGGGRSHASEPTQAAVQPTGTTSSPNTQSAPTSQEHAAKPADGRPGGDQTGRHGDHGHRQAPAPQSQSQPHPQPQPQQGAQQEAGDQQTTTVQQDTGHSGGHGTNGATKPLRRRHADGREGTSRTQRRAERAAAAANAQASSPAPPAVTSAPLQTVASTATVSPTAATPPQSASTAPPAVAASTPQASRAIRRAGAHKRVTRARTSASPTSASALAPVSASAFTPTRVTRDARVSAAPRLRVATAHSSPLARTITKLVGVVPTPVRVLIGLLVALALAMGVRTRLGAVRAGRLERQREQLLEDVGLLQTALLPVLPERLGPVATSAAYRPAAGPGAGGDFYDVFALEDGRIAIILGDVSGHGREALPHTALARFTLRAYLEAGLSPRGAVQTAGDVLERQLGESFATVVLATYQPRERTLVYACAGHPPPVVLGSRTGASPLELVTACSSPPLGVGKRTGTRQTVLSVPGGCQLCFYTDGVTEARVGAELFGGDRLVEALAALGPRATASALLDRVAAQADSRPDDMAACVLGVEGGAEAPSVLVEELELDREEAASDRTESFLLACGVDPDEIAGVVRGAREATGRAGNVILRLHLGDGRPEVTLQRDNLTYLPARRASRQAVLGVSR